MKKPLLILFLIASTIGFSQIQNEPAIIILDSHDTITGKISEYTILIAIISRNHAHLIVLKR